MNHTLDKKRLPSKNSSTRDRPASSNSSINLGSSLNSSISLASTSNSTFINPNTTTRFDTINRYNVAIISLRNQLKQAAGIDELTILAGKIIDLEQQILVEKTAGYKELEKEKVQVESKIDKMRRELRFLENDLQRIDNKIDLKVNVYRTALQGRIENLSTEYSTIVKQMKTFE